MIEEFIITQVVHPQTARLYEPLSLVPHIVGSRCPRFVQYCCGLGAHLANVPVTLVLDDRRSRLRLEASANELLGYVKHL